MTACLCAAYLFQCALIAVWMMFHPRISEAQRRACNTCDLAAATAELRVSVVVPARNEAGNLADCLDAVLAQRGVALELIVVDDRSTDETGDIAERTAARDARCRVIRNMTLPRRWTGKSHACLLGARASRGDWLLFLDADVRLAETAIASAVDYAGRERLDLLSLWPRDGSVGFWEKLLVPLCGAMIVLCYGRAALRSHRGRAFANGQFLLMRRATYAAIGEHERVRSALIEDVALAAAAAADGLQVGSALGADLLNVRMYGRLRDVARGWRRIFVGVLTPLQLAGCLLWLLIGSLAPIVVAAICAVRLAGGAADAWTVAWMIGSTAHLLALFSVSVRFFGMAKCDLRYLWLYPLSVLGVMGIVASALWARLTPARVSWRGDAYCVRGGAIQEREVSAPVGGTEP